MDNETYFYCYSPQLKTKLLTEGERFICVGLNESTQRKFWLFKQTEALGEVLAKWSDAKRQ